MGSTSSFKIETQVCGLIIVLIVMMLSFCRSSLSLESRRSFNYFVVSALLCLLLDILSVFLIVFLSDGAPIRTLTEIEAKAYVAMLVVNCFFGFKYFEKPCSGSGSPDYLLYKPESWRGQDPETQNFYEADGRKETVRPYS